jgi:hypothetical protein
MTTTIPTSVDQVTAEWLGATCAFDVSEVVAEQIGVGVGVSSGLYRLRLTGGDSCPSEAVLKLPALDPAAVFTSSVLRMYIREVRFFEHLAAMSPIRVPKCFYAAVDESSSEFVLVLEDVGNMRMVDQLEGMSIADAERAIDELAAWHATWWRKADDVVAAGQAVSLGDPIYPAILPMVFGEGWAKVSEGFELPSAVREVGDRYTEVLGPLLQDLSQAPTTLCHGDFRADNILFAPDGSLVLLDFQLIGSGSGAYDLAYFVTQSLDPAVASAHERALFDRWIAGLRAKGVPASDLARMWEDYRKAALFCLVYPVVASRGMDITDPRQRGLLECMMTRNGRAIEELGLADLMS